MFTLADWRKGVNYSVRFDETFDYLKRAPVLGLDDLGAENPSS
ncbi:MAG: hypothetical protein ACUVX1_15980 [Chloroflexota bacterium]